MIQPTRPPLSANWSRNDTGRSSGLQCRCASTRFASALAASKSTSPSREFGTILATSRVNAFLSNIIRAPAVEHEAVPAVKRAYIFDLLKYVSTLDTWSRTPAGRRREAAELSRQLAVGGVVGE